MRIGWRIQFGNGHLRTRKPDLRYIFIILEIHYGSENLIWQYIELIMAKASRSLQVCAKPAQLRADRGTYLLMLSSKSNDTIQIGKLGVLRLQKGFYAYVGSAFGPGGIKARVGRHMRDEKTLRWHIDYLRRATELRYAVISYNAQRLEDEWSSKLAHSQQFEQPSEGFGASDSKQYSHLFYSARVSTRGIVELLK